MKIETVPFEEENEEITASLASQAAVAVENRRLTENIRRLFEGFVEASVTAIEQRDPTTSGHSERVALLSCGLAELADRTEAGPFASFRIGKEELRELRYAAVLHDFGKVGVREWVLVKARKFRELQAANGGEEIATLEVIDRVPRMLQSRELTDGLPFAEAALEADDGERV